MMKRLFPILFGLLLMPTSASAIGERCDDITATVYVAGSWITNDYTGEFDTAAATNWTTSKYATNSMLATEFNGDVGGADHTQDLIDVPVDYVVLLLGSYDSGENFEGDQDHTTEFAAYTASMEDILDRLAAEGIVVILGIPPPRDPNEGTDEESRVAEGRLESLYRPWIIAEATERLLVTVDFNGIFRRDQWPIGAGAANISSINPNQAAQNLYADGAVEGACVAMYPTPFGTRFVKLTETQ